MQLSPENLLKALYDTLPDPVLVVDGNRQVVAVNAAAMEKFGFTREELVGMNAVDLYAHRADADEIGQRGLSPWPEGRSHSHAP
jgi:PAS domain S-box-containing protein